MDYQEAIEHAREVAKRKRAEATYNFPTLIEYYNECKKCADEHEQLADWLEELKQYKQLGTLEEIRESMQELSLHQYCGEYHYDVCALEERNAKLREYEKIGSLEEVRDAVEKQKECKDCGYKIHSDRISELNSCNDCGLVNICKKRPEYGQYCRINCYDWKCRNE